MDLKHFLRLMKEEFIINYTGLVSMEWFGEFYAEGLVALWKAYKEFDEAKGNVGTYLNYQIRFRLLDLLRKKLHEQTVLEEIKYKESVNLVDGNRHRATGMPVVNVSGIALEDISFWHEVRSRLSDNQWKWVKYFIIADLSIKEIMEIEGVSADAVIGWGRAVRDKLKDEELKKRLEEMM